MSIIVKSTAPYDATGVEMNLVDAEPRERVPRFDDATGLVADELRVTMQRAIYTEGGFCCT